MRAREKFLFSSLASNFWLAPSIWEPGTGYFQARFRFALCNLVPRAFSAFKTARRRRLDAAKDLETKLNWLWTASERFTVFSWSKNAQPYGTIYLFFLFLPKSWSSCHVMKFYSFCGKSDDRCKAVVLWCGNDFFIYIHQTEFWNCSKFTRDHYKEQSCRKFAT